MSASSSDMTTVLSNLLGAGAVGANQLIGNKDAANAQVAGLNNSISTEQGVQTTNSNLLGTQENTGNSAMTSLQSYLGLNGQPADFSQFYNTPGYQFAVDQGTNAVKSAAAANGSAYTPNTLAAVGNYVQGAASTNYNNYINQLLQTSQLGSTATQSNVQSNLNTGANIAQSQAGIGSANASGAANQSNDISGILNSLGGAGGISSLLSSLLGGTGGGGSNTSGTLASLASLINGGVNGLNGGVNGLNSTINTGENVLDSDLSNTGNDFDYGNLLGVPSTTGASTTGPGIDGTDTGLQDWLDGNPSGAGGQAATSSSLGGLADAPTGLNLGVPAGTTSGLNFNLSNIGSAYGIINGATSGTAVGQAGAGLAAAGLANKVGALGTPSTTVAQGLGAAGGALGVYTGLTQGGGVGDTTAATGALKAGSSVASVAGDSSLAAGLGAVGGAVTGGLALEQAGQNFKPGDTGGDALDFGEAGAEVGSAFGPIGTLVGGAIGAVGGALIGALDAPQTPQQLAAHSYLNTYGSGTSAANSLLVNPTTGQSISAALNGKQSQAIGATEAAYKINGQLYSGNAIQTASTAGYNAGLRGDALNSYITANITPLTFGSSSGSKTASTFNPKGGVSSSTTLTDLIGG